MPTTCWTLRQEPAIYRVRFERQAASDYERALAWWRENRTKAPDALKSDVGEAIRLLRKHGSVIGTPLRNAPLAGVRRLHLDRVRYHLYFNVIESKREVVVLAIWHASRGRQPKL